jgi:predicted amidohydrolase YtcJ
MAPASDKPTADTIYLNGNIYSGEGPAKSESRKQALAVAGDRIIAIGSNDEVRRFRGEKTRTIDLGGHFVIPGFNDAHLHLASAGFAMLDVNLAGTKSLQEIQAHIAARAKEAKAGEWIVGRGWDHTLWPGQKLPSRQDIDGATGDHPAYFVRVDGHIALANTVALKAAGINRETKAPAGGQIDRDSSGQSTGIFREGAQNLIAAAIPKPTLEQRRRAAELALADAARWGVTSLQDFSSWEDFLVYEDLEREGKLTARISEWLTFNEPVALLEQHRAHHPQSDPMLRTGMLKGFMDGSLGSRTAAMLSPYADDQKNSGLPQYDQVKLNQMADERVAARFQMGFHAIGDAAAEMALDAFAEAERYARERNIQAGADGFRFRVEHAQVVTPEQIGRFRELKVIASMQPCHLLTDMNWALARLGPERARYSYAWKAFLDKGVALAFGTDYPVEPITPFRGLYAAVTRKNEAGTAEYFPEQKINIEQAIAAYTSGAAYAEFSEKEKGVLKPGMLADFVVLDRDLTAVSPHEILGTQVLRTVVGGKTVYEKRR